MMGLSEEKIAKWGQSGKAAKLALAKAMGNVKDEQTFNILITYLRDRNPEIRIAALESLEKINSKNAIEHVRGLINDPDPKVSEKARSVLKALHR